jgi:iron complex outermembrane receptor protein
MKLLALAFDCFHGMRGPSKLRGKWVGLALAAAMPSLAAAVATPDTPASQVTTPHSTDNVALEEIVVTAQKKEESLQKVPISVQVVGGQYLQEQGIPDLERLSTDLPQVSVRRSANSQRIVVRGVGSGTNRGFEQSVGTFEDGVYLGQGQQIRPELFDISRVEVLKGPQSTLFGANVTAGAFNIVTNDPTSDFQGSANLIAGSRNEFEETGVVSGPLTNDLSARAAFYKRNYDGDVDYVGSGANRPTEDKWGGRLVLAYQPTAAFSLRGSYEHQLLRLTGNPLELIYDPSAAAALTAQLGLPGVLDYRKVNDALTAFHDIPNGPVNDRLATDDASLKAVYKAGDFNITSVTGYTHFDWNNVTNFSYSPPQRLGAEVTQSFQQISEEIRADGSVTNWLDVISGAYYHHQQLDNFVITEAIPPFVSVQGSSVSPAAQKTDYGAIFGQGTVHLGDKVRLTGGLRYDILQKDVHDVLTYTVPGITIFGANAHDITASRHENHVSWLGRIEYDLFPAVLVYASSSRGFKSGGFDINGSGTSKGNVPSISFAFAPEEATNYEVGLKSRLFDNKATLNISAYHLVYDNLQVSQFTGLGFAVGNADAKTNGFDVDYRHAVTANLTLGATVGYNDFKFSSYPGAPCTARQNAQLDPGCSPVTHTQDLTGKTGEFAPKVSGSVNADWRSAISNTLNLLLNVNPVFSSQYYTQIGLDPNTLQKSYTLLNARIGVASSDDRWEFLVVGRNLTGQAIAVNSFTVTGGVLASPLVYGKVPIQRQSVAADVHFNF